MADVDLVALRQELEALRTRISVAGTDAMARWGAWIEDPDYRPSAENLAHYLALRGGDRRDLQLRMMQAGLSSMGRAESRVMPTLDAVVTLLGAVTEGRGMTVFPAGRFFTGRQRIDRRTERLLGPLSHHSSVRLMVTLPTAAADDPDFAVRLAEHGVEAVRINGAHDSEADWLRMIGHVDAAAEKTGWRMRVMFDLPGPKIRTGAHNGKKSPPRVHAGDDLGIARPGRLDEAPKRLPAIECTLAEALDRAEPGHRVFVDDGKLDTVVTAVEPWGLVVRINAGSKDKGYKLKPEKGINFPDSEITIPALTDADRQILRFAAHHVDAVQYSFVQDVADVEALQDALAAERPDDWRTLGLVLKIETSRAVRNLPDLMVRAAGRQPAAVMIARGDLAVEIGFSRLAEMQEEILWLAEAAQIPVIWATQVMESLLKTGVPSRGEMTDAASAARAECVMLNKGPYILEGIAQLDQLLGRMSGHIDKKSHTLRRLMTW